MNRDTGDDGGGPSTNEPCAKLRLMPGPKAGAYYGQGWLNNDEYIVEADLPHGDGSLGYYTVNVHDGNLVVSQTSI